MKKIIATALIVLSISMLGGCTGKNTNQTSTNITGTPEAITEPTTTPLDSDTTEDNQQPVISTLYPAYKIIAGEKKYGFIDKTGSFVIEPVFSFATDFSDERAVVSNLENGNFTDKVIDLSGNVIFDKDYDVEAFHNQVAIISDKETYKKGYIDINGNIIVEPKYNIATDFDDNGKAFVLTESGKYELIDMKGTTVESIDLGDNVSFVIDYKDGYVIYSDANTMNVGVIKVNGETILEPNYREITYLGNDLFGVKEVSTDPYTTPDSSPSAIFDKTGKQITEYIYYDLTTFNNGYASATDSTSTYFIGLDGKVATNMPKLDGRGTLILLDDMIKADIDKDLLYLTPDNKILWQNDTTRLLSSDIKIQSVKLKPNKYVLVYYPVVDGLQDDAVESKINDQLKQIFVDNRKDLKEEEYLSVEDTFTAELKNNLLIIKRSGYDYNFGAAHGMPIKDYYHIDINTGDFYSLDDLFKKDSDYVTKLNDIILEKINKAAEDPNSMIFVDSFETINDNQFFTVTDNSLIIYFYPYEIAAYAAGFPEFEIPFDEINDMIDTNGAFWNSFQK
ncbi:MAG: repeat protein [Anaerocolumna sp.]|jgi:hypothetical protein|nr:repeat protein [Anaerocolumna sp.]